VLALNQFYEIIFLKWVPNQFSDSILYVVFFVGEQNCSLKERYENNFIIILYMLSKFAHPIGHDEEYKNEFIREPPAVQLPLLSYREYVKNKFVLAKFKLPELKNIARSYKLPI